MAGRTGAKRLVRGTTVVVTTLLGLAGAPSALAATFDVNSTADAALGGAVTCAGAGSECTLRAAIQAADAAGGTNTITLPAGTYTLTMAPPSGSSGSDRDDPASGDLDVDSDTTVTVTGSGAAATLIDTNGLDRAFTVHTGAGLKLTGLSIEGGAPAGESTNYLQGGAIYTDGTLSTDNVAFTANSSGSDGGAVYADTDSRLSVDNSTFTGNASEYGGAIEDASQNPAEIDNVTFSRESAYNGGGDVYYSGAGALTISGSSFTNTVGIAGGGAVYSAGSGQVSVSGSQFVGDSSSYGGAIYSNDSISLTTDGFSDDTATGSSTSTGGGALYMEGASATQTLVGDEFSNDSSSIYGGAIYTNGGSLAMTQSSIVGSESEYGAAVYIGGTAALFEDDTMAQNSAIQGGALYLSVAAPLTLVNDTIARNTATAAGGGIFGSSAATAGTGDGIVNTVIAGNVGGDCDSTLSSAEVTGYDLDSDSSCFGGRTAAGLQIGVQPALAAPADNGGQVLTMLEEAGSPTLGTGDGAYCPPADARGVARDPSACDLGAYQAISTGLTASNSAAASAAVGETFMVKLSATNAGPGIASNLTLTDELPAGTTLAGEQPSSGACSVTGDPATVTCDLGTVGGGASASVVLFVSSDVAGTFTNAATVSDDQGASGSASAQTEIIATTAAPTVSRAQIRQITRTAATLRARLDPHANTVSYFFEYGTTHQFGRTTRVTVTNLAGVRSARIVGLLAGKRYYFRLVATSGAVVSYGTTYSFVTRQPKHRKPKTTKKSRRT